MADALLYSALSKYFQAYLRDFERNDFKFKLKDGEARLANVQLKVEAIEPFIRNLPLRVVSARIQTLTVKAKLTKITSEPVAVIIDSVKVELAEAPVVPTDPAAAATAVAAAPSKKKQSSKSETVKKTYPTVEKIVDGLRVEIGEIVISLTLLAPELPKLVLRISNAVAATVDENWHASPLKRCRKYSRSFPNDIYVFKLVSGYMTVSLVPPDRNRMPIIICLDHYISMRVLMHKNPCARKGEDISPLRGIQLELSLGSFVIKLPHESLTDAMGFISGALLMLLAAIRSGNNKVVDMSSAEQQPRMVCYATMESLRILIQTDGDRAAVPAILDILLQEPALFMDQEVKSIGDAMSSSTTSVNSLPSLPMQRTTSVNLFVTSISVSDNASQQPLVAIAPSNYFTRALHLTPNAPFPSLDPMATERPRSVPSVAAFALALNVKTPLPFRRPVHQKAEAFCSDIVVRIDDETIQAFASLGSLMERGLELSQVVARVVAPRTDLTLDFTIYLHSIYADVDIIYGAHVETVSLEIPNMTMLDIRRTSSPLDGQSVIILSASTEISSFIVGFTGHAGVPFLRVSQLNVKTSKAPNLLDVSVVVGGEAQMVVSPVFLALVGHVLDQHDFSAAAVRAKPKEVDEPAMPELLMRCVVKRASLQLLPKAEAESVFAHIDGMDVAVARPAGAQLTTFVIGAASLICSQNSAPFVTLIGAAQRNPIVKAVVDKNGAVHEIKVLFDHADMVVSGEWVSVVADIVHTAMQRLPPALLSRALTASPKAAIAASAVPEEAAEAFFSAALSSIAIVPRVSLETGRVQVALRHRHDHADIVGVLLRDIDARVSPSDVGNVHLISVRAQICSTTMKEVTSFDIHVESTAMHDEGVLRPLSLSFFMNDRPRLVLGGTQVVDVLAALESIRAPLLPLMYLASSSASDNAGDSVSDDGSGSTRSAEITTWRRKPLVSHPTIPGTPPPGEPVDTTVADLRAAVRAIRHHLHAGSNHLEELLERTNANLDAGRSLDERLPMLELDLRRGILVQERTFNGVAIPGCFLAAEAVTWIVAKHNLLSRNEGIQLLKSLCKMGTIEPIGDSSDQVVDDHVWWRFRSVAFVGSDGMHKLDLRDSLLAGLGKAQGELLMARESVGALDSALHRSTHPHHRPGPDAAKGQDGMLLAGSLGAAAQDQETETEYKQDDQEGDYEYDQEGDHGYYKEGDHEYDQEGDHAGDHDDHRDNDQEDGQEVDQEDDQEDDEDDEDAKEI